MQSRPKPSLAARFGRALLRCALASAAFLPICAGYAQNAPPPGSPDASRTESYVSPLTPLDATSPRASLQSIRTTVGQAAHLLIEALEEREATPGLFSPADADRKASRAGDLLLRASRAFDFSQVPPASLRSVRLESVLLLKEILDRIPLPSILSIPDAATIEAEAEREKEPPLASWSIPGTEITFRRVDDGSGTASYLVSAQTVNRLEEFYDLVADRPLRPDAAVDLYDYYSMTPGLLFAPKWLARTVAFLPDWAQDQYRDQALWQWITLFGGLVVSVMLVFLVSRTETQRSGPRTAVGRTARQLITPVFIIVVSYVFDRVMYEVVNITGPSLRAVDAATYLISILAAAWCAVVASNTVAEWILESPSIPSGSLDANLLRAAFRLVGIGGAAVLLGIGATHLGIPLFGVIAGLGVGGLAIALAAQPTIENFIGGIILYTDRPVRVGDDCQFGDMRGFVEEIGIRSTRIRSQDRTLITVPNADFAKMRLINFSRRDRRDLNLTIGLRHDTTPDQMRFVLTRLKELLYAHPLVMPATVSVRFVSLAASALNIELIAALATRSGSEFDAVREDLFLRCMDLVKQCGTGLAIPSQTLYLTNDAGIDTERREATEAHVQGWRDENRLPFPDLAPDSVQTLRATLDWPPAGSPSPITEIETAPKSKRRPSRKAGASQGC